MKIVKKGWVGRRLPKKDIIRQNHWREWTTEVLSFKGTRDNWQEDDWPPRRCVITVEVSNDHD